MERPGYPELNQEIEAIAVALLRNHGLAAWLAAAEMSDAAILAGDADAQRHWDAVLRVINRLDVQTGDGAGEA